ncbi:hypothetical protein BKA93DRAFT_744378, partial [Sparassis latifolia]
TPAEKKALAMRKKDRAQKYKDALANAQAILYEEATKLHMEFGSHSIEYYLKELIQVSQLVSNKCASNHWNVYQQHEVKHINDAHLLEGSRYKLSDLIDQIKEGWDALSSKERITVTDPWIKEFEECREMRQLTVQNVAINAFHDTKATLDILVNVHAWTGTEVLMLAVRSSADHYNQPHVFMTSEKLVDFFTTSFNATLSDVAVRLEGFCLSGIPGLLRHSQDAILQLKASISALILRKLRETAGTQVSRMYYVNFEQHITDKYGVMLKNWPLEKFCSPSMVNSRTELDVLLCAWNTNATLFHRLSTEELEKWRQGRFERQMEDIIERVYDGATHHDSNEWGHGHYFSNTGQEHGHYHSDGW